MNKVIFYILALIACTAYFFFYIFVIAINETSMFWKGLFLMPIFWIWSSITGLAKKGKESKENIED